MKIGDGRTLEALCAPEGEWWLVLAQDGELCGRMRFTPSVLDRLRMGHQYVYGVLRASGGPQEAKISFDGQYFGSIRFSELTQLMAEAEESRHVLVEN